MVSSTLVTVATPSNTTWLDATIDTLDALTTVGARGMTGSAGSFSLSW